MAKRIGRRIGVAEINANRVLRQWGVLCVCVCVHTWYTHTLKVLVISKGLCTKMWSTHLSKVHRYGSQTPKIEQRGDREGGREGEFIFMHWMDKIHSEQ